MVDRGLTHKRFLRTGLRVARTGSVRCWWHLLLHRAGVGSEAGEGGVERAELSPARPVGAKQVALTKLHPL